MSSILHLNVQDYVLVCICCTSKNAVLIKLSSCEHTGFLANYINMKIDLKNTYICNICHNMLKKIEVFKRQVEESTALILNQVPILKINKLYKLEHSSMEIDGTATISDIEIEVKLEAMDTDSSDVHNVVTNVKVEEETLQKEIETVLEVQKEKTKRRNKKKVGNNESKKKSSEAKNLQSESKYKGKIGVVILTDKEVAEERDRMAKNEAYLKLPYKCKDCIVGFERQLTLDNHIEKRHKKIENGFQCNICKSITGNKFSASQHPNTHIRRLECLICRKRYNRMQSAIQHYDEQHAAAGASTQQGYSCNQCSFTTTSKRAFRYHMDKHTKKHNCDICGNIFANKQGLKVHLYTVHKQCSREYKCSSCNKSYRSRPGLEAHERTAHGTKNTRAFCADCGTNYSTAKGLQQHLSTHSRHVGESDKRFICDDCGAKFAVKSALQDHINWEHVKLMMHRCRKCKKVFKSVSNLKRHVNNVHNKKKPLRNKICDYCGKAFTTQAVLQAHIRTHTGERPLHCSHCPATFAHSAALYNHNKLLHTDK